MMEKSMRLDRKAPVFLVLAALALPPNEALAQGKASPQNAGKTNGPDAETTAKAQQHFQRARELYQAGSYHEAIAELEAANKLDPTAKDLVLNLATVHERAGEIDEAMHWMSSYLTMELDAGERQRGEATMHRLEGAKKEIDAHRPPPPPPPTPLKPPPVRVIQSPPHGRIDVLTVSALVVGVAGFGVGTYFGVRAVHDRPDGFVTGRDGTYADLVKRTDDAHKSAIYADIGFGVGIVGVVAATILYFSRTRHKEKSPTVTIQHGGAGFGTSF
jgi:tetratricopeptide (TPR) repeat protein